MFISSLDEVNTGLSIDEVTWLQKKTLLSLRKKQVSFEDLPALMHINYVLGKNQIKYKHIVVDEAQDYGLFHFDVLKEITPCNSTYSIYGDLAQAIYSYRSIKSWDQLNEFIFDDKFQILNLNKSYRTTIEITNNANKVLNYMDLGSANPVIRHGSEVLYSDICDDVNYKINIVKEWIKKGYKTVAIICKTEEEAKKVNLELLNYGIDNKYISSKDDKYEGGVFVLTSVSAKGLEFDAVVINDASSNVYNCDSDVDMHLLYVACTRALHEQVILYNGELTMALGDAFLQGKKLVRCKQLV